MCGAVSWNKLCKDALQSKLKCCISTLVSKKTKSTLTLRAKWIQTWSGTSNMVLISLTFQLQFQKIGGEFMVVLGFFLFTCQWRSEVSPLLLLLNQPPPHTPLPHTHTHTVLSGNTQFWKRDRCSCQDLDDKASVSLSGIQHEEVSREGPSPERQCAFEPERLDWM